MDVRFQITLPTDGGRSAASTMVDLSVDLAVADLRGRPLIQGFAVPAASVLPGIRTHHDVRRTLLHDGRYWMAVADPDGGGLRSGPATEDLVRETVGRFYVAPALRQEGSRPDPETFAEHLAAAARLGADNLAVFADGRLYEADVVPVYEIKLGLDPCVCILPSSARHIRRAAYFRPDRAEAAEAFFRGKGGRGQFPVVSFCGSVAPPEEEALWSLAEAARSVVSRLDDGVGAGAGNGLIEIVCGPSMLEALAALRLAVTASEPSLADLVAASNGLVAAAGSRLRLDREDVFGAAVGLLDDRARAAERLMAERAPAMTDPPAGVPSEQAV